MERIKLCIFDMDGLLLDTERHIWFVAQEKYAKEYGKEMTFEMMVELMGHNYKSFNEAVKEKFGDEFPTIEFSNKVREYYREACINTVMPLMPGVKEILEFLKKNNILISLGTSTEKTIAELALSKAGILKYFDFAVYGDEVKNGKPDPETYSKSVEHFGFNPQECIVFEDTSTGAKAAYNGNINLIMVPDLKQPEELDRKKAFAIIESLEKAIPIIKKINNII